MDPRRPSLGALVAAVVLVAAVAILAAGLLGAPPFGPLATPTPSATPVGVSSPSGSPVASATPLSGDRILEILGAIERRMVVLRELNAEATVQGRLVTAGEATSILVADFREENPPAILVEQGALYRALGLLGPTEELGPLYERFLASQVLGFYRTDDRSLYVISDGRFGPLEQITAAHEYTHALQDQHFDLEEIQPRGHDQGDQSLARLALIEGDATLAMFRWAATQLTASELADLLAQASDPAAQEALESAPAIVRDTAAFPYVQGLTFVQRAWLRGGWADVDRIWQRAPDTTEQVLHPDRYEATEAALTVRLPVKLPAALGDGWRLTFEDTQGELVTRIWLEVDRSARQEGAPGALAAATGWGGDRIGLYRGPGEAWAVVWPTRWDAAAEATEFTAAARAVAATLDHAAVTSKAGSARATIMVASDEGILDRLEGLLR